MVAAAPRAQAAAAIQVAFTLSVPAVVGDTLRIALPGFSGNTAENCSYVDGSDAWVAGFGGAGRDAELLLIAARASPARTAFDVRVLSRCSYLTPSAGLRSGADAGRRVIV